MDQGIRLRALRCKHVALAVTAAFLPSGQSYALPTGEAVVAGDVTVTRPTAQTMQINQATQKGIVNWLGFSIGAAEHVNITQPSASASLLNRVVGNNPSEIFGRLTANGRVFLVNPNGVLFAPGASVEVGSLFASSLALADQDFLAGRYQFAREGNAGSVVNQGSIVTANGYTALIGPQVRNDGVIVARTGAVALAAGERVALDLIGDGLISVSVDQATLNASVVNTGRIEADGGTIVLTARSANALLDTVINTSGIVRARTLVERNGEIVLDGGSAGVVAHSGTLDVSGTGSGETGGTVTVRGQHVYTTEGSSIDASGVGSGGTVVVKGAETAYVYGGISARGTGEGAAGGFAETSGGYLELGQAPDVGAGGTWLIDPYNITVVAGGGTTNNTGGPSFTPNGDDSQIGNLLINGQLNGGASVVIDTGGLGSPGAQDGDITVNASIIKNVGNAASLTLNAARDVTANASILLGIGTGSVNVTAGRDLTVNNTTVTGAGMNVTAGGAVRVLATVPGLNASLSAGSNQTINSSAVEARASAGAGTATLTNGGGTQTINTGTITLANSPLGGNNSFAGLLAGRQRITATDVTMTAGASAGTSQGVRIGGGAGSATDLVLTARDLTLNGGELNNGVAIGSSNAGVPLANTIVINARNVALNSGTASGSGTRIGSGANGIAGGDIAINATGSIDLNGVSQTAAIRTSGNVSLGAATISQGASGLIAATGLSLKTAGNATLTGQNQVVSLSAPSSVPPALPAPGVGGNLSFNNTTALTVSSEVSSGGTMNLTVGGALTVAAGAQDAVLRSNGGQTITAQAVTLSAASNRRASIQNTGGDQSVTATVGDINLSGPANGVAQIVSNGAGNQTVTAAGQVAVQGGNVGGTNSGIFKFGAGGVQKVQAATVTLQGAASGSNASAIISSSVSDQLIQVSGNLNLIGGDGGQGNNAVLTAGPAVQQTVFAHDINMSNGSIGALTGGLDTVAAIVAGHQLIDVTGNVTLTSLRAGLAGAPGGPGVRIGGLAAGPLGPATATDLTLLADGNLTVRGGLAAENGAAIGSTGVVTPTQPPLPNTVNIDVGGNVTVQGGGPSNTGARIGSGSAGTAGGNISIKAGGTIELNPTPTQRSAAIRTLDGVTLEAASIMMGANGLVTGGASSGNVLLSANAFNLGAGSVQGNNGAVILRPRDGTRSFGIESAGDTTVSNADLAAIGTNNFVVLGSGIGSIFTGNMTIGQNAQVNGGAKNLAFFRAGVPGTTTIGANGLTTTGNVIVSAGGGALVSNGGTVSGNQVQLRAAQGIGSATAQVLTQANRLAINNTGSQGVFVTELGDVTLGDVNLRVGTIDNNFTNFGGTGPYNVTANGALTVDGPVTTANGAITLTAESLTNSGTITNGGGANTANMILIANAFDLAGGSIQGGAAGVFLRPRTGTNSLGIEAAGDTTLTNADIASISTSNFVGFGSGTATNFTGDITIGQNAQVNGGTKNLVFFRSLSPGGTITIGTHGVATAGDVIVSAGGGAIVSNGGTVAGDEVQLRATQGIGTSGARVQTAANALTAGTSGSAFVTEADDVTLRTIVLNVGGNTVLNTTNTSTGGALDLSVGRDLNVAGPVTSNGLMTIAAGGALNVTASGAQNATLTSNGGQTISAQSLLVSATGGQALISNNGSGNQTITISGGGTGAGVDVRTSGSTSGLAQIENNAFGSTQTLTLVDGDHLAVNGAGVLNPFGPSGAGIIANGSQAISVTGSGANAVRVGSSGALGTSHIRASGSQTITAGSGSEAGSITITGPATNSAFTGIVTNAAVGANTQTISTTGAIDVTAGSAPSQGSNFGTGIFHNLQGQQTINAADIFVRGGTGGSNNTAFISTNPGSTGGPGGRDQVINVSGDISVLGSDAGSNNRATIVANNGNQTINAGGDIFIRAGASGVSGTTNANIVANTPGRQQTVNARHIAISGPASGGIDSFAGISGTNQLINATGNVTLTGGASGGTLAGVRIGGFGGGSPTPTNLTMNIGGDLVLTGGAAGNGVGLGSSAVSTQPNTISITAGGSVILNEGSGSGARIGSADGNVGGGTIAIAAGSNIELNGVTHSTAIRSTGDVALSAGGTISEGASGFVLANRLTTNSGGDTTLTGPNQVSTFSGSSTLGNVSLVNTGNLDIAGITTPGRASVVNIGDINESGAIHAASLITSSTGSTILAGANQVARYESASASNLTFNNTVALEVTGAVIATGSMGITVAGALTLNAGAQDALLRAGAGQTISAQSVSLSAQNNRRALIENNGGNQHVTASAGDISLHVAGGAGVAQIVNTAPGSTQTISASGQLNVLGGAIAGTFSRNSGLFQIGAGGMQDVSAAGITLQGAASGTNAGALISSQGDQRIDVTGGDITLIGGSGGTNTSVSISAGATRQQTVLAHHISLSNGEGGNDVFANIAGGHQTINATGNVTLSAQGAIASGTPGSTGVRIGANGGSPTDLRLTVGGDLILNGGSAAGNGVGIGSSSAGVAQVNNIVIDATGSVILNGGSAHGTNARIGSSAQNGLADGSISITAGSIELNGGSIQPGVENSAAIRTLGSVTLHAGTISENANGLIIADTLTTTTTAGSTSLGGANQVARYAAGSSAADLTFINTAALEVTGAVIATGAMDINVAGALTLNASAQDALLRAGTGQTITAQSLTVSAQNNRRALIENRGGDQSVTASAGDISLHVADGAGVAQIVNNAPGGDQTVTASGQLRVLGGAIAGTASRNSGIFNIGGGLQTIRAAGITLQGAVSGTNAGAIISSAGAQMVDVTGGNVTLIGGNGGIQNNAVIIAGPNAQQTVLAHDISLSNGVGGIDTVAGIFGDHQLIDATGSVTLTSQGAIVGGAPGGPGVRIGAAQTSTTGTNLTLLVDGSLSINGGSVAGNGASIGSSGATPVALQNTIRIEAGGSVTLNAGTLQDTGVRIGYGQNGPAGGEISITAGGSIALNGTQRNAAIRTADNVSLEAASISQAGNGLVIANALTTRTSGDASLTGPNQVSFFTATTDAGNVSLRNTSALLTLGSMDLPGTLSVIQTGDVAVGSANALDATLIYASGDISVAASGTIAVRGSDTTAGAASAVVSGGTLEFNAGNVSLTGGGALATPVLVRGDLVEMQLAGRLDVTGGSGHLSPAVLSSGSNINLEIGDSVHVTAGSGLLSLARIQTEIKDGVINIHFPELSAGGYFVNGVEGREHHGQTGFFTLHKPAQEGRSLLLTYGE